LRGLLVPFLLLSLSVGASAQCDCIDKGDIKERLKLASAAIKGYGQELMAIGTARYTPKLRVEMQARVNRVMGAARTPGRAPMRAEGSTTNNCDIEVRAPTRCLEAAIRAHEKVHQDACRATWEKHQKAILLGKGSDRFEAQGLTMSAYIMEEVTGYQAEISFLNQELARLNRDCQQAPPQRHYTPGRGLDLRGDEPPLPGAGGTEKPKTLAPPPMPKPKPLPTPTPY
jgi:hypothetical protein